MAGGSAFVGCLIRDNTKEIRAFLKHHSEHHTFLPSAIDKRQQGIVGRLKRRGWPETAIAKDIHASWNTLDDGRKSAACVFEQHRTRFFVLTKVLPYLQSLNIQLFFVTLANSKWRVAREKLMSARLSVIRRKARDGVENLRKKGLDPVLFGMVEVSGGIDLEGNFTWEPHMHLLVGGVTEDEIREAFKVRMTNEERGRLKPLKIIPVGSNLGQCLSYLCKFKPELRKTYVGTNGRPNRGKDLLEGEDLDRWTSWMAKQSIMEMVVHFGIRKRIMDGMINAELAELAEEMT